MRKCRYVPAILVLFTALFFASAARAQYEVSSYAFVQDDGSLKISGEVFLLYGVYIPPTAQICYEFTRPMQCGSRASLALNFRVSGDFVRCQSLASNSDGSRVGYCTSRGEDLSAFMLQRGWAVALPDAPFEYAAMEKIARAKGLGVWGSPIDTFRRKY